MAHQCPHCQSRDIRPRNLARRFGGAIGSLAGAATGIYGMLSEARICGPGNPTGPYGAITAAVCAATLRGIVGATIGCEIGTTLGELIDEHVLENDCCKTCGSNFREDASHRRGFSRLAGILHPGESDEDDDQDDGPPYGWSDQ